MEFIKKYSAKTLRFQVMNTALHDWDGKTLALVPIEKTNNYKSNDILYLDCYRRFECLMKNLYPQNRKP